MTSHATAATSASASATGMRAVHRVEVHPKSGMPDPLAHEAITAIRSRGLEHAPNQIHAAAVYLIEGPLSQAQVQQIAEQLLTDPVTQEPVIGAREQQSNACIVEVHPLPGVMDPDAAPIALAIDAMLGIEVKVSTGRRYEFVGVDAPAAIDLAEKCLANRVIQQITTEPFHPSTLPAGEPHELRVIDVPIRDLDDEALVKLSREAHLFLSLEEMRGIQREYQRLGREPREIELETLAQTWSEHCVHKTLKSKVTYREHPASPDAGMAATIPDIESRPGHTRLADGSIHIDNLLKSTVAAATHELMNDGIDWCLSVFVDNAGVIAFDDDHAVCFKVETHNHPSAIEPYGGAATGIGGCIRDIIGTGLAAKPIANSDVFCVARPDMSAGDLPAGCLHPRRILTQVVAGVRDYGNRMGIPTLNGAVWFDDRYVGNPLVYCGCVGVMPRDKVAGEPQHDDHIIALGGRTGRDGIHGATFSSAELTDTHADEFSHAVQIGNPVEEKKVLDAILEARDHEDGCLYNAITDCGAGGFSSAVGEMGEHLGATVQLERAPLKYEGLTATEIWISEAQERMVLAVPASKLDALRAVCDTHNVELCDLGTFGTENRELILRYGETEVGRLSMQFMHEGVPDTTREAVWPPPKTVARTSDTKPAIKDALLQLLAHPNIASKHWIIRQYDHEVQGGTVVKPLVGEQGIGPSDAAVVTPVDGSSCGIAIANGLATGLADDPYVMTLAAIDECVRNLVCVGADPDRIAILDNFCWPGCDDPQVMGGLVRAAEACYDGAKAYRTPFISGKDSLNNQFTTDAGETIRIPPTMLISGIGMVDDVAGCITMDAKRAGNVIVLIGPTQPWLTGSHYQMLFGGGVDDPIQPHVDLDFGPRAARSVHAIMRAGLVRSAHDGSDGGLLTSIAEMCIAGGLGADLEGLAAHLAGSPGLNTARACFGECASCYVLEVAEQDLAAIEQTIAQHGLGPDSLAPIGSFVAKPHLRMGDLLEVSLDDLREAWRSPLDW